MSYENDDGAYLSIITSSLLDEPSNDGRHDLNLHRQRTSTSTAINLCAEPRHTIISRIRNVRL